MKSARTNSFSYKSITSTRIVRSINNIFAGDVKITRSDRFSLRKSGDEATLIIENVELEDEGSFTCRIMLKDEINLTHQVNVIQAFNVRPVSNYKKY